MMSAQRNRRTAVILAWLGVLIPGLHKFYLGQHRWGILYLLMAGFPAPISRVACAVEGVILFTESDEDFAQRWNRDGAVQPGATSGATLDPAQVSALGVALRELDTLRQEGLISELEFEQKRRRLLDQVA